MTISRLVRRIKRRREITVWSDSRSLPFTEGQAITAAGQIGPAYPNVALNAYPR